MFLILSCEEFDQHAIQAIEYGSPFYLYFAGTSYLSGSRVNQNYTKAIELFEKAAKYDYIDAFYELGNCYLGGKGVDKDEMKAIEYYERAVNYDDDYFSKKDYATKLGDLYYNCHDSNYIKAIYYY